jgi:hypothetical protein
MIANLLFLPVYSGVAAVKRFGMDCNEWEAVGLLTGELWPGTGRAFASALTQDTRFNAARKRLVERIEVVEHSESPATVRESIRRLVLDAEDAAGEVADSFGASA